MKLLELTLNLGINSAANPKITINPDHIVYIRPSAHANVTIIQTVTYYEKIEVLEKYENIVKALGKDKGKWL